MLLRESDIVECPHCRYESDWSAGEHVGEVSGVEVGHECEGCHFEYTATLQEGGKVLLSWYS